MGGRKVTLTIDEDVYNELSKMAKQEGFGRISTLVRHLAVTNMRAIVKQTTDRRIIKVSVENYRELLGYVTEKKLSNVEVFACYAMESYMNKNKLTDAQKERVKESIG